MAFCQHVSWNASSFCTSHLNAISFGSLCCGAADSELWLLLLTALLWRCWQLSGAAEPLVSSTADVRRQRLRDSIQFFTHFFLQLLSQCHSLTTTSEFLR
jgi:hypothetical protein